MKGKDLKGHAKRGTDPDHVSTSYVERQNLTMRMSMTRFARLSNGFSKKLHNHECAVAMHYMFYNFGRIHKAGAARYPGDGSGGCGPCMES